MSLVRAHCSRLSDDDLWNMFDEMDRFEKTGVVPEDGKIRIVAKQYMDDTAIAMYVVGAEVWHELAMRGGEYKLKVGALG